MNVVTINSIKVPVNSQINIQLDGSNVPMANNTIENFQHDFIAYDCVCMCVCKWVGWGMRSSQKYSAKQVFCGRVNSTQYTDDMEILHLAQAQRKFDTSR